MLDQVFNTHLPDFKIGPYFRPSQEVTLWVQERTLWIKRKHLESYLGKPVDAAREQLRERQDGWYLSAYTLPLLGIPGGTEYDYQLLFSAGTNLEIIRNQILQGSTKYFKRGE